MIRRLLTFAPLLSVLTLTPDVGAVASAELYRLSGEGYGKYEARLRFAFGDGIVSSFFLWKDGSEQSDVFWNELDFEKLGADCKLQTNSIYGLPQTSSEKHHDELMGLCDSYHTYTYEWTPDYIAWFVDGVEIRRDTGPAAAAYAENALTKGLQFRFNVWPGNANFGGNFQESSLPAYEYVDWAQFSEYTPGAGEGGSDFTLSWREDFESSFPAGWSTGSWRSPLNLSTHDPANVVFVDGVAVLALTADAATGYTGTPPQDTLGPGGAGGEGPGGAPTSGGRPASSGGAATSGGSVATTGGSSGGPPPSRFASGCSLGAPTDLTGQGTALAAILAACIGVARRTSRNLMGRKL